MSRAKPTAPAQSALGWDASKQLPLTGERGRIFLLTSPSNRIPWRVPPKKCTPLLHRLQSARERLPLSVNRYGNNANIAKPVNFNPPPEPPAAKQKTGTST